MKHSTLFIAPPGTRKSQDAVFDGIRALCPRNDYSSVLYLGPDAPFLAHAKRLFHDYHTQAGGGRAYIPFRAVTIKQLSYELYEACGPYEIISDEIRTLLLLQLLEDNSIGYARILSGLLSKIRHYIPDKDIAEVRGEISGLIFEDKARDRALSAMDTLLAYEDLLAAGRHIDSEIILKETVSLVQDHTSISLLVIAGFHDPTPLEQQVTGALINTADNVLVLAEDRAPFSEIMKNVKDFSVSVLRPASKRTSNGFVTYASIEDEVEGIAKNIKKLLLSDTLPGEITLSFPDISRYIPMVRRVFGRYGIPVSIGAYKLSCTKPVVAINDIITCIEDDYPRADFLSVLTSPLFPAISPDIRRHAVSLAYRAGIIKGREAWCSIEKTIINESMNMSDHDKVQTGEFQRGLNDVIDLMEHIRHCRDLSSYVSAFMSCLDRLGYFAALAGSTSNIAGDIAGLISAQFTELRRFASALEPGDRALNPGMCLRFVLENLGASDSDSDGVRVVPFDQAAGLETKELFFGGMIEGEFPSRPRIDPIMPEKVKQALGMPHMEYYLTRQRQYFTRLLNISERPPCFSYPAAEREKMFLPSPFLDWDREVRPDEPDIFSDQEVLVRDGEIMPDQEKTRVLRAGGPGLNRKSLDLINERLRGYLNVTDIDAYRKCPMRFYIERVLRLQSVEPPKFEVEARLWGSLAHRVMERLFAAGDEDGLVE